MSALMPYVDTLSRAGTRYAQYNPRLRTAYAAGRAARFAYDHHREAAHAARVIQRAAKRAAKYAKARARPRSNNKVGETVSSNNSKRCVTVYEGPSNKSTRTQYYNDILDITRGTQLDNRQRDIINVRGFKLCMEVKSLLATFATGEHIMFNIALISNRNGTAPDAIDFFRNSSGDARSTDFSNGLTSTEFHCLPINTDKYAVLMHKRFMLGDSLNDANPSHLFIEEYIPINRQFRYNDGTTSIPNNALHLIYWADISMLPGGSTPSADAYQVSNTGVVYFKETCNC